MAERFKRRVGSSEASPPSLSNDTDMQKALMNLVGNEDSKLVIRGAENLKKEVTEAGVVGRSTEKPNKEFVIPVTSREQKERVLDTLYDLSIFPWEEDGLLIVDHHRDLDKLRLIGLIEEPVTKPLIEEPNLAFPLERHESLSEHVKERAAARKQRPNEERAKRALKREELDEGEELEPGIDTELADTISRFDQGIIDEDDEEFTQKLGVFPSMKLFPRQYIWNKGVPTEKRTGRQLSLTERNELYTKGKGGDPKALTTISRLHAGLVLEAVVRVREKFGGTDVVDSDDLFQEGMLGLLRAVELYDQNREDTASFGFYAMFHIEARIRDHAYQHKYPIKRPRGTLPEAMRKARANPELYQDDLLRRYYLNAAFDPISEDGQEVSEESYELLEPQTEEVHEIPRASMEREVKEKITATLGSLTPREERVLRMLYGVGVQKDRLGEEPMGKRGSDMHEGMTLEEVGNTFGVTRERIREIEAKALRKLKHPARSRALKMLLDYYENEPERVSERRWKQRWERYTSE